jgi:cell division protein FtsW
MLGAVRRTAKDWLDRPMTSYHLITATFYLLLGFGLLMVLSASSIASFHANGGSPFATFENQALFAVIGLIGFFFASKVSHRLLRTYSFPLVAISLLMLAVVLVSRPINGARSWLVLGPIQFQPSEVAKLALLIWMGNVLAARRNTLRSLRSLLIPVLPIFVIMVGLIMLEPDLGTTVSLGLIFIAVLWFGGAPWWMFATLTTGAAGLVVYLANSAGYRSVRVLAWLHPENAPPAATYQIRQSLYGLGSGHIFGVGLGQSVSKTGWLPNADSDFIFAIIGEELGLIGAGLLLVLFATLAYTGLRIARRNTDPFIKIVASAATIWLVGQAAINIGYVIGLLPVTGIPLPMISRGGTSLVITMVVFGLLANFARREPQAAAALRSQGPTRMARFLGLGVNVPKPPKARKPQKPRKVKPERAKVSSRPTARPRAGGVESSARGTTRTVGHPDAGRRFSPGAPVPPAPRVGVSRRRAPQGDPRGRAVPTDREGRSFVDPGPARRLDPRQSSRRRPEPHDTAGRIQARGRTGRG